MEFGEMSAQEHSGLGNIEYRFLADENPTS